MDMLHTVIRPSMDNARMASPVYSIACPVAPAVPIRRMSPSTRSLAVTPAAGVPSNRTSIVRGRDWTMHWVARTCSTSLVPMPNASAPKAPWVDVCESAQTMIMPGWVSPSSGPITCTIPCSGLSRSKSSTPNSRAFRTSAATWRADTSSAIGRRRSPVETLWSTVATVRFGRRTRRPARRSPSNACGEVTSWTRCRST